MYLSCIHTHAKAAVQIDTRGKTSIPVRTHVHTYTLAHSACLHHQPGPGNSDRDSIETDTMLITDNYPPQKETCHSLYRDSCQEEMDGAREAVPNPVNSTKNAELEEKHVQIHTHSTPSLRVM